MVAFLHACFKGLNGSHLTSAISFEFQNGYYNLHYRRMRFRNFLHPKLLRWYSKCNRLSSQKLLKEASGFNTSNIPERSKLLNEVSVVKCYGRHDLFKKGKFSKGSPQDADEMVGDLDLALACDRFPSIILGDSSLIELYEEVIHKQDLVNPLLPESFNSYFPYTVNNTVGEALHLIGSPISSISSSSTDKDTLLLYESQIVRSDKKTESDALVNIKKSSTADPIDSDLSAESILDKTVRCLPNATSRQFRQLEDSGFHTIRKLLHYFPRTYVDLHNAQDAIKDGNYLIFVGTVLSSRGVRAGLSFAFLEVVVGCELSSKEPIPESDGDVSVYSKRKTIFLHLKKFFRGTRFTSRPFLRSLQSKYQERDHVCVSGKVKEMRKVDHFEMREYSIDKLVEAEQQHPDLESRPYPLYPSKAGLSPDFLRDIISRTLKILPQNIDPIPKEILEEFSLIQLYDAYFGIHHPKDLGEADLARRRLVFDEFFYVQFANAGSLIVKQGTRAAESIQVEVIVFLRNLGKLFQMLEAVRTRIEKEELLDKYQNHELYAVHVEEWSSLTKKLLKGLPYSLTPGQLNAVSEIIYDLKRPVPMNRLLQGDVGCGKTIVAFLACMEVIGSGYQAAFMVPTELLAIQHYELLLSFLENFDEVNCKPSVALLTGSTPSKQSRLIRKGLQEGDISLVIGTHSLIADKVEFSALRIAVVDEQHRFGVIQRGRFNSKLYSASTALKASLENMDEAVEDKVYMAPHVLTMSATPIPRSLALALFGDMSLTQITDLPPGREPVKTFVLEGNEAGFENVFQMMRDELVGGGRIYLVYPIIDESEQLPQLRAATVDFDSISEEFESYPCGLLHGRMKSEEKDDALKKFRSGETRILLATQVIEIGVDVPDASMMVVMNAERFGIAQLHQLRGRVGRGARKSKCVFLSSTSGTLDRLKVLEKSTDAFYLANADLLLRGPGNLLGKKQSGHLPEFPIARLEIDGNILQEAHLAALKILATSNDLEMFPRLKAELSMRQPLCLLGD